MNDNDQNFSSTPYKATGNLNTMIGNPNININSAVTSNIMEGSGGIPINPMNSGPQIDSMNSSNNLNETSISNMDPMNSVMVNSEPVLQEAVIPEVDPVQQFINKNNEALNNNIQNSVTNQVESIVNVVPSVSNNFTPNVSTQPYISETTSQVRYENVYETTKKNNGPKKTVKIPSEFKTAIFVVLILLIVISCFEPIFDFFRNLDIFG